MDNCKRCKRPEDRNDPNGCLVFRWPNDPVVKLECVLAELALANMERDNLSRDYDSMLKQSRLIEQERDTLRTHAWLVAIHSPTGRVSDTEKWSNGSPMYMCASGWTHDVLKATRHARKEDAQAVADRRNLVMRMSKDRAVAEEHGFAPTEAIDTVIK